MASKLRKLIQNKKAKIGVIGLEKTNR